jgi:hypothetical protein
MAGESLFANLLANLRQEDKALATRRLGERRPKDAQCIPANEAMHLADASLALSKITGADASNVSAREKLRGFAQR